MKNTKKILAALILLAFFSSHAVAATVASSPIPISANVDGALTLTIDIRKNTASGPGAAVTNMSFGTLKEFVSTNILTGVVSKTLRSSDVSGTASFAVLLTANSHQLPYVLKQTASPLSSSVGTIPAGACAVKPVYATQDNGGSPLVGSLGVAGSWVTTDKVLYTSDSAGSIRTIQAVYTISDDPAAGATAAVPINQAGGTYNSTVTFTVTTA